MERKKSQIQKRKHQIVKIGYMETIKLRREKQSIVKWVKEAITLRRQKHLIVKMDFGNNHIKKRKLHSIMKMGHGKYNQLKT
jgi:hypothetical protein